jgi:predicted MFS family arabinose efflux permease
MAGNIAVNRRREIALVFRAALRNPELCRVVAAYTLFVAAEFGLWIALLVFAYRHGGATAGLVMVLIQLVPCVLSSPLIGALADRHRVAQLLRIGYALQAGSMAALALAIGMGVPVFFVFLLAPITAVSISVTRPPQAALLPAIVRTADELTAANVMTGWTDGAGSLVGPAIAGILLAWRGPGLAVAAMAAMSAGALVLILGVAGPAAAISTRNTASDPDPVGTDAETKAARPTGRFADLLAGARSNLRVTDDTPHLRILFALHTFYFVLIGSLDLLCVILAVELLHMGSGGPGFLNAALGAGALVAGFVTTSLVGRRHLSTTLIVSLALAVSALAAIELVPHVAPAILLVAMVGLAGAVFDVTCRTLLQRSAPPGAIAGTFSVYEALTDLGLALGAVLVRVALAVGGIPTALCAPAAVAAVLVVLVWHRLRTIDSAATVPQVEIQLLRSIPLFAALPAPSLEAIARQLRPLSVASGTVVVTEGEPGDLYYAVADGELTVARHGRRLGVLHRGDGFGEIALIRQVPRTATVTAQSDALLYVLGMEPFVLSVTGHASMASAVGSIITDHLRSHTSDAPKEGDDDMS